MIVNLSTETGINTNYPSSCFGFICLGRGMNIELWEEYYMLDSPQEGETMLNKDCLQSWERRHGHSCKYHSILSLSPTSASLWVSSNSALWCHQNNISFQNLLAWFMLLHGFRITDLLSYIDTSKVQRLWRMGQKDLWEEGQEAGKPVLPREWVGNEEASQEARKSIQIASREHLSPEWWQDERNKCSYFSL